MYQLELKARLKPLAPRTNKLTQSIGNFIWPQPLSKWQSTKTFLKQKQREIEDLKDFKILDGDLKAD